MKVVICLLAAVLSISTAFQVPTIPGSRAVSQKECRHHRYPTFLRAEGGDDNADLLFVKSTLETQYPNFYKILSKNDAVWKALANAEGGGFTIFAPNAAAFAALGQNKWDQLLDARNLEQTEKIGAFHVIAETVTAEQLFNRYVCAASFPQEFGVLWTNLKGGTVFHSLITLAYYSWLFWSSLSILLLYQMKWWYPYISW